MSIHIEKETLEFFTKELSRGAKHKVKIGYLVGMTLGDSIIVDGINIPQQQSSETSTIISKEEQERVLAAMNKYRNGIVGLIQYNGNFGPYKSKTTEQCMESLTKIGVPNLLIVVNSRKQYGIYQ